MSSRVSGAKILMLAILSALLFWGYALGRALPTAFPIYPIFGLGFPWVGLTAAMGIERLTGRLSRPGLANIATTLTGVMFFASLVSVPLTYIAASHAQTFPFVGMLAPQYWFPEQENLFESVIGLVLRVVHFLIFVVILPASLPLWMMKRQADSKRTDS